MGACYLVPMVKLADLVKAGWKATVLLADVHAVLDARKAEWEVVDAHARFYRIVLEALFEAARVPPKAITFVRGSSFQLTPAYTQDMFRLMSVQTLHDAKKAGTAVVKQSDNPLMSSLIYPGLQALDEEFIGRETGRGIDAQLGGLDQRKIFFAAEKLLPRLGYRKRIHLLTPIVPSFKSEDTSVKMTSTDPSTKISFLNSAKAVDKKISKAFCEPGSTKGGLFLFLRHALFPLLEHRGERFEADGQTFDSYEALEAAILDGSLHPAPKKMFDEQ